MAETVCGALRTAVAVFAHRMCTIWCKSLSQPLKRSSLIPHEAPDQARPIAGRVVYGSRVDIFPGSSARDLQLVFEVLCDYSSTPSTAAHRTRCTPLRANHSHRSEIAECFALLPVVYRDGTFKMTPLTL